MRVLLTGANGFIGSHLLVSLLQAGHSVRAAVREPGKLQHRFPGIEAVAVDMNSVVTPAAWSPLLQGVDAIVNCAGILHSRHGQNATAVHATSPIALFEAARMAGVSKIVQMSAIGVEAETEFARTKLAADEHLSSLDIDWTILRPSIVYGQQAYGGTALLRALAATPACVPVIGKGQQTTTPIHVDDLCATVLFALSTSKLKRKIISPCGPQTMRLADMIAGYRGWLGLKPAPELHVPMPLLSLAGRIGDLFGTGPVTTTSLRQLEQGTAADPRAFSQATGLHPRPFADALSTGPVGTADLWHAQLYLLRPVVRASLILLWLVSGVTGLLASADTILNHLGPLATFGDTAVLLARAASVLDLGIAAALLINVNPRLVFWLQMLIVLGYTVTLTLLSPALWGDLFGALLKNIPVLALIIVQRILSEER